MLLLSPLFLASAVLAWNPGNSYTPSFVDCPSDETNFLRSSSEGLNSDEAAWVEARHNITTPALVDYLTRVNLTGIDPASFLSNTSISMGIAFSGGGYRAMLCGAGAFAALDNRTEGTTSPGHLGGIVQAATYLAGLSGGSWLVGSIVTNNFTTIDDLLASSDVWDLSDSIFNPGGINVFSTAKYYDGLADAVDDKRDAGFNVSLTDIWGRALSQQFIDLTDGGPAMTWDDIRSYDPFTSHEMPFPVIVSDGRAPNTTIVSTNSTNFEITPYELGSWDPSLEAFTDIRWLGSNVTDGKPNNGTCVLGYDNSGFTMGTSSTLFNQFILRINSTSISGVLKKLALDILDHLSSDYDDVAIYAPNPFLLTEQQHSTIEKAEYLTLVDGGEDSQNVPLYPLIQPERNLDVIIAFDNTADTDFSWPNSNSLIKTYERQFGEQSRKYFFPSVPDNNTFINKGFNARPVFFGCYASNFTQLREEIGSPANYTPPLIVWNSNGYYTFRSNTSTFQMSYESDEMRSIVENTYAVATYGNGTLDAEYGACLGCAIIQRETERRGINQTEQCKQCFDKYCWDGSLNSTHPSAEQMNAQWAVPNVNVIVTSNGTNSTNPATTSGAKKNGGVSVQPIMGTVVGALILGLVAIGI